LEQRIPDRKASIQKTTRGKKNVDTRLGEEIEEDSAKLMQRVGIDRRQSIQLCLTERMFEDTVD